MGVITIFEQYFGLFIICLAVESWIHLLVFKDCLLTMALCKSAAGDRIKEIPYAPHCVLAACAREIFTRTVYKKDIDAIWMRSVDDTLRGKWKASLLFSFLCRTGLIFDHDFFNPFTIASCVSQQKNPFTSIIILSSQKECFVKVLSWKMGTVQKPNNSNYVNNVRTKYFLLSFYSVDTCSKT